MELRSKKPKEYEIVQLVQNYNNSLDDELKENVKKYIKEVKETGYTLVNCVP